MSFEEKKFVCCICGEEFRSCGNSPWPINKRHEALCCDECALTKVLAARMKILGGNKKTNTQKTMSERLKMYFSDMNEKCLEQTGEQISIQDILTEMDSDEFKDLFDKE